MSWANLFLVNEWNVGDVALRKWSLSCRICHHITRGQDPVLVVRDSTVSVAAPGCCFASASCWACTFSASPADRFWLPLSLGVVTKILIRSWSLRVPPQIWAGVIRTSRSPPELLPAGAHLGLSPSLELGQHIPRCCFKTGQAGISHPSHPAGAKGLPCVCTPCVTGSQGGGWPCI